MRTSYRKYFLSLSTGTRVRLETCFLAVMACRADYRPEECLASAFIYTCLHTVVAFIWKNLPDYIRKPADRLLMAFRGL